MPYFCARLLFLSLVDDGRPISDCTCEYSFFIVAADTFKDAFEEAVSVGNREQLDYLNCDGNQVRWVLKAVEELRELGTELSGIEVGSLFDRQRFDEPVSFDVTFDPTATKPTTWTRKQLET